MTVGLTLREIARAMGGELSGRQVLCPGPGHSPKDRSLSIRESAQSPTGLIVFSHAGDDWRDCQDYVAERLGLPRDRRAGDRPRSVSREVDRPDQQDDEARIARATALWNEGREPRGTVVERYLASRGLSLPDDVALGVLRYHPACPWRDRDKDQTIFVPAMLAPMRGVITDRIMAVHRTRLTPEGAKVERRVLGPSAQTAVKLDPDTVVTGGLAVGEGIETCLAGREMGIKPAWALYSTSNITSFPVLPGIEVLTLLGETGEASDRAVGACAERWHGAGREVLVVEPVIGSDLNDALREVP